MKARYVTAALFAILLTGNSAKADCNFVQARVYSAIVNNEGIVTQTWAEAAKALSAKINAYLGEKNPPYYSYLDPQNRGFYTPIASLTFIAAAQNAPYICSPQSIALANAIVSADPGHTGIVLGNLSYNGE